GRAAGPSLQRSGRACRPCTNHRAGTSSWLEFLDRVARSDQTALCTATRTIDCHQKRWHTVGAVHVADQALCVIERDPPARHVERPLAGAPQDLRLSRRACEAALCNTDDGNTPMQSRKEPRAQAV